MTPQLEAEQALLGAVLLAPRQLTVVSGWLEPRHFHRPAHVAIFEALLAQRDAGHRALSDAATEADLRDWALQAMTAAALASPSFTPGYGHTLIEACPQADHAPVYGRMVLETAVRRALQEHAHRLLDAASAGRADADDAQAAVALTLALQRVVEQLSDAWGSIDNRRGRRLPAAAPARLSERAVEATLNHEAMLLGSLTAAPGQVGDLARWLRPEDFLDPGHGAVYQALVGLSHRGEPVDALTVLWEVQRRGALTSRVTSREQVRALCRGGFTGDPGYWAELVLRASLIRSAATSAGIVRVLALDASLSAAPLLGSAVQALEPALRVQRRWRAATGQDPPPAEPAPPGRRQEAALTRSHTPAQGAPEPAPSPAGQAAAVRPGLRSSS
ncbi:DnaB-like helicase N-terminal domain-containing protein [Kitasatospora indigofera]|uniref:DnaB-like helicase N-terminal domain-containing protein n=1 Tax=Kitasatospora indigofera TaxID=67307 RepID=UPI003628DFFC